MPRLEGANRGQIAGDGGGWGQIRKAQDQKLFRAVAHPERVIHDERFGVDHLKKVRRGDITHVKGRILPQPDHVKLAQIHLGLGAIGDVVALLTPQLNRETPRHDAAFDEGQLVRGVEKQRMPARLRLKPDAECRVAVDVDRSDRIHLQGYFETHGALLQIARPL